MLCIECNFQIDEATGVCLKCGRIAFKIDEQDPDKKHVEPYSPDDDSIIASGRVPMIKFEPEKNKLPLPVIISNIVLVIGILLLLVFYLLK